jgi:hypothetical protein
LVKLCNLLSDRGIKEKGPAAIKLQALFGNGGEIGIRTLGDLRHT